MELSIKMFLQYIKGPALYSTYQPSRRYVPNFGETLGNRMIYLSNLIRALIWPTSPIWIYYSVTRGPFITSWDSAFYWIRLIVVYHFIAYSTRAIGRSLNNTYKLFAKNYSEAMIAFKSGKNVSNQLRNYDFQIQKDSPVSFIAKHSPNLWYLSKPNHLQGSFLKMWFNKIVAYVCVHTFGLRMLYPGSIGLLKALLFQDVSANRLKLIMEQGGKRWQIKSVDGNIIDGILFDRREVFPNSPLIICCDGNGGFYETGILKTPAEMHYSVLGWNPPGFSESTGNPYPINILNAADAVMQFAFEQGFTEDNIVIFGWSIGGFPGTWLTANYPNIRGLILDASFDHVLPLAYRTMPSFTEDIVKLAIEEYFNLDVATQLDKYNGPVKIVRRFNDEIVTSYHGNNEVRRRRENRGNYLLARFLRGRYPDVLRNEEDTKIVFKFLNINGFGDEKAAIRESRNALLSYPLEFVLENDDLRTHLIRLLAAAHFHDVMATHVQPLKNEEFIIPEPVNYTDFGAFLRSVDL